MSTPIPVPWQHFIGLAPEGFPQNLPIPTITLAAGVSQDFDLTVIEGVTEFRLVQGIFVDNSSNPNLLQVKIGMANMTYLFPPFSQGTLPLPAALI